MYITIICTNVIPIIKREDNPLFYCLTHFSISYSFLDIPLISRYPTHFSISHSFLDKYITDPIHNITLDIARDLGGRVAGGLPGVAQDNE